jgi:hypothetical protein
MFYTQIERRTFHTAWVKGGCGRQADGTAGLPPAPEIARVSRHLRFVPEPDLRHYQEPRWSRTRIRFLAWLTIGESEARKREWTPIICATSVCYGMECHSGPDRDCRV